mmetsp:Transcript_57352/g.167894  ORF Transcript_57352/g.167894 Transcript_57352/m.167894 type:complete len:474 (+) Transcript_57352:104-1525(+)
MKLVQNVKQRVAPEDRRSLEATRAKGATENGGGRLPPSPATTSTSAAPEGALAAALPKLRDSPAAERPELFKKKMQACSVAYDFRSDASVREKEAKRQTLLELTEYVNATRGCFHESTMQDVVGMVGANIFRALPHKDRAVTSLYDPEDEEPTLEPAWPHLQIVYEFFLRFVVSNDVDPKIAKRYVDSNFVAKLLDLFDSEDPRERDYLKTILHRVYGKFMALRSFIRRAIQHTFFKVIYECEMYNGVGELLEILGSVINGFALPLKEEHKDFLLRALIPLHKVKALGTFHQQLSYCMAQYVEKDPRLAYDIIMAMLRFWPLSHTSKQVLYLTELEETLELAQPSEFSRLQEPLFRRIAACITCPHFQVAERTLFLWNNDSVVKLINHHRQVIFPLVIPALYANSKQHWNSAVHGLTFNVLKLLMEADSQLFDECSARHRREAEEQEQRAQVRTQKWAHLQELHDSKLALFKS